MLKERGLDTGCVSAVIPPKKFGRQKSRLEYTLPPRNDGAGRRVSTRIESCFQPQSGLLLADLLACPSRVRDESDPVGSRTRTRCSAFNLSLPRGGAQDCASRNVKTF